MARLVKFLATATMIFASTAQIASANIIYTHIGRPFNDQDKKRKVFCLPNNFTGEGLQ